jgi:peptidoglycan/LPS O-acetylase OafA/YrhL
VGTITEKHKPQLPALTGLRIVLAIWVVGHHLTGQGMMLEAWARRFPVAVYRLIHGGFLAVGTFFVLSGFVLVLNYGSTSWDRKNLYQFGVNRLVRFYPVYLLSMVVVAPFIIREALPLAEKVPLVANYLFLLQGWTGTLPVGWNTPAWALSCEVFFYLCFPLAVVLTRKMGWRPILAVAALTVVWPRAMVAMGVPDASKPILHLADFTMGILAARAYGLLAETRRPLKDRGYWLYLPALAVGAALIAWPGIVGGALDPNSALRLFNALFLVGLALGGGLLCRWLSSGIAVFLGKTSYAIYILHVPLLWWYARVSTTMSPLVYVAAVMAISAAAFRFVEEPASRYLRRRLC